MPNTPKLYALFRTLESIATPCSVNAIGWYHVPPLFEVAICNLNFFGIKILILPLFRIVNEHTNI